jgi:hypothetical protein
MNLLWIMLLGWGTADPPVAELRKLLDSSSRRPAAMLLYERTRNVQDDAQPLLCGYRAVADFMICRHSSGPFTKLGHFREGVRTMEAAVKRSPADSELRYLRYIVQRNAPAFLGYRDALDEDRMALLAFLARPGGDPALRKRVTLALNNQRWE